MVYVRLEQEWTDGEGTAHAAGTMVDVDAGTLAELEAQGIVADPDGAAPGATPATWAGPTGGKIGGGAGTETWAGPTGGKAGGSAGTETWAGPTGGDSGGAGS